LATGLIVGNNYKFKVQAVNHAGLGEMSLESTFIIAARVPDPPVNLVRLYANNFFITIGWEMPLDDGGSPVFGYEVYFDEGLGLGFTLIEISEYDSLMFTIMAGIVQGKTYTFKVKAFNVIGLSDYSQSVSVIAANFPDSPKAPTLVS
jgi:hypothetical protein